MPIARIKAGCKAEALCAEVRSHSLCGSHVYTVNTRCGPDEIPEETKEEFQCIEQGIEQKLKGIEI